MSNNTTCTPCNQCSSRALHISLLTTTTLPCTALERYAVLERKRGRSRCEKIQRLGYVKETQRALFLEGGCVSESKKI